MKGNAFAVRHAAALGGLAGIAGLLALVAGCSSASSYGRATFHTRGSVQQVAVTDAAPREELVLVSAGGKQLATARADTLGSALFRKVTAGRGLRVRTGGSAKAAQSPPVTVLADSDAPPTTATYDQTLPTGFGADGKPLKLGGYGYLTVRDGTKLAINVRLPGPAGKGPYPTVIEYGGYAFSRPGAAESSISPIWNALGYAVVDVNMRGTGCSGGAFDFFERLQSLDGYDAVETVARQPWVLGHRVGMAGISYGGISQLFVAQTNPPHLAAITPASVIEGVTTTLRPGAMLNTGFALTWTKQRDADAKPASATTGQPWAWERIKAGDSTCRDNQKLHGQAVNQVARVRANADYVPSIVDPLTPARFVHKIKVPVFLACQWEDEQTGGACPFLADKFDPGTKVWQTYTNGTHVDSLDPDTLARAFDFLELYVAKRVPQPATLRSFLPAVYASQMGVGGVKVPDDPFSKEPDYAHALAAFEKTPRVRVLFESGYGSSTPGAPVPGFELTSDSIHDPRIAATPFYLDAGGALATTPPTASHGASFVWDPAARPERTLTGDDISQVWKATPPYRWAPLAPGKALAWVTAPLDHDLVVVGGGALDVWMRSTAPDTDLQVTVSEVRPDGQEVFVQNGWLRASYRKLDAARSTPLTPYPSGRKGDLAELPVGQWSRVSIPLYAQGHAYRKGSRLRVSIEAPGGDQPEWAFDVLKPTGKVVDSVVFGPTMPSRLLLPVVRGFTVPTRLPAACRGLRGEPCRAYVPFSNSPASPTP